MHGKRRAVFLVSIWLAAGGAFAQVGTGTMHRPTAPSETTDSEGHPRTDSGNPKDAKAIRGTVTLTTGPAPLALIPIIVECAGAQTAFTTADSKGHFAFKSIVLEQNSKAKGCMLQAFLEGYRSEKKPLADLNRNPAREVGELILQPISGDSKGLVSASDEQASKSERRQFEKAINQAADSDWPAAIASLLKLTSSHPEYTSAWLGLGTLQLNTGDRVSAKKSFAEAVHSDPNCAPALIQAAALAAKEADWENALKHSTAAIELNPAAFPDAYAWNALANLSLQHGDAAQNAVRKGLELDKDHQYPELEYALGVLLYGQGDTNEARKHLQAYLDQAPNGSSAEAARNELRQGQPTASMPNDESERMPKATGSEAGPSVGTLRERNAAYLTRTPSHTCLESVSRLQVDTRGRVHDPELLRVEVAVSDGKEIYGDANGKRFSAQHASDLLGFSFSSTGLFSSIARGILAGDADNISFVGTETLKGERVFLYNFRVRPDQAGWSIQYGDQSGKAEEEGSFYVSGASLLLRRVAIHTVNMPSNLKLRKLDAVIDYQLETVANERVLLPYVAEIVAQERAGTERVSRILFDHCRSFAAESTVSFDTDVSTNRSEQAGPSLPDNVDVVVSLASPINMSTGSADDLLTATVATPVISRGRELVARGAIIEGHVYSRSDGNAIVIEFDRVKTERGWAPFYARLVSLTPATQARIEDTDAKKESLPVNRHDKDGALLPDPHIPGVAILDLTSPSVQLAIGTKMVWKTEPLVAPVSAGQPQLNTSVSLK